jgi:hypothetical protein
LKRGLIDRLSGNGNQTDPLPTPTDAMRSIRDTEPALKATNARKIIKSRKENIFLSSQRTKVKRYFQGPPRCG